MSCHTVFINHSTRSGRRDDVELIWRRYMLPAISTNPGHVAYAYCFGVEPLLKGPPQITVLEVRWIKGHPR